MKKNPPNNLACDNVLIDIDLQEFIDKMDFPIFLLDQTGTIKTVNAEARILFKKQLLYFKGKSPGEVFECKNAYAPGGCGKTIHCSGCAIRKAITTTALTGEEIIDREATLNREPSNDPSDIQLLISTKKLNDTVLLKIVNIIGRDKKP